ncbi:hypothetical protein SK128_027379 [Halocaridina rubra]|uniref:Uncharacterized protein n=1 Tax=Halocaridina rubra TaxID=373956 RepID=A0AAN9A321_HALRR
MNYLKESSDGLHPRASSPNSNAWTTTLPSRLLGVSQLTGNRRNHLGLEENGISLGSSIIKS